MNVTLFSVGTLLLSLYKEYKNCFSHHHYDDDDHHHQKYFLFFYFFIYVLKLKNKKQLFLELKTFYSKNTNFWHFSFSLIAAYHVVVVVIRVDVVLVFSYFTFFFLITFESISFCHCPKRKQNGWTSEANKNDESPQPPLESWEKKKKKK